MTFNLVLLLTDLAKCAKISDLAKMNFSNLIWLKIVKTQDKIYSFKNSAVFARQAVLKFYISYKK